MEVIKFIEEIMTELTERTKEMTTHENPIVYIFKNAQELSSIVDRMNSQREMYVNNNDIKTLSIYDQTMTHFKANIEGLLKVLASVEELLKKILILQINLTINKDTTNELYILEVLDGQSGEYYQEKAEDITKWAKEQDDETILKFFS